MSNTFTIADLNLEPEHIANLEKLATFLESDQIPPPRFDIASYINADSAFKLVLNEEQQERFAYADTALSRNACILLEGENMTVYSSCGTTACAVGHGPLAGIPTLPNESWTDYEERVFGVSQISLEQENESAWEFLFGSAWRFYKYNNTAKGSALRIRWLLAGKKVNYHFYGNAGYIKANDGNQPWFDGVDLSTIKTREEEEA